MEDVSEQNSTGFGRIAEWRARLSSVVIEITGEMSKGGSGGGEAGEECATAEPLGPGKAATPALN